MPATAPARAPIELVRTAVERYSGINDYIVRLTRREEVKGKKGPEELILFKFRKSPWSLYMKWLGEAGRGREVVYGKGQFENKIHTLLAAGDSMLMPAGKHIALAPDSPLVRGCSRYPITEAGIGASIERLTSLLAAQDRGDRTHGTIRIAEVNRIEFPRPVLAIEQLVPAGIEPDLNRGGRRLYCFDPETNLPMLVIGYNSLGHEVEYYRYDHLMPNVGLDNHDFDPDVLWANPKPSKPASQPPRQQ